MKPIPELLDDCGSQISAINDVGAAALATLDDPAAGVIRKMLAHASKAGLALQGVADAVLPPKKPNTGGLKPGQVVVDVGAAADDLKYTGTNRWQDMTRLDWAFYFAHDLRSKQAIIFVEKPQYIDPVTGANYNNKDAEFRDVATGAYPDLSGYTGPLAAFV